MKILDMHCDTISELLDIRRKGDAARIKENTLRSNGLHIDLEKMKKSRLPAAEFCFVCPPEQL